MEKDNNFKKVFEREAPQGLKDSSLRNAQGSVHTVKSFFDVLDLYISKFFGAILHSFKDGSNIHNVGIGAGVGYSEEDEEKSDDEGIDLEEGNEEDWYSDDDLPKDL